ncbi:MAG: NFACT RNA binding domain-containing protein [Myxococcales bacterium]|nr:NFACT RNA binding domain-containing protein [Myxococcales bacterium]
MTTWNAKIARVDQPEPGLLTLSFRSEAGKEVLVIVTLPGALGLGVVGKRPRGARASPAVSQLRRHLEGARIEEVAMSRRAARLSLTRARKSQYLFAAPSRPSGAWWLCEPDGSVVVRSPGAPTTVPFETAHLQEKSLESLRACGASVVDAHLSGRRRQLERLLDGQIKRLSKKRDAIREDLERAATAEALQERAGLILAHASEIPPHAAYFEATTWGANPKPIQIDLDPRKSPAELAQELFKKAKRLKRGLDLAPAHLRGVEEQLAELHREREQLGSGSLHELEARLEALGVSVTAPKEEARRRRQAGARLPYRKFLTADGSAVLVGRSAADNDRLTLRVARPHDLWLHARGVTGAHIIVPLTKGKSCSPETLVDAATLAAHFSDLRAETVVDVLYTPRKLVHKRKGSAVGSVTLGAEKVIALRLEPERLQRLLKSEKKAP